MNMKIKFENKTLEISKAFANKASVYDSEEYRVLRAAVQDLPDFKVVIKVVPVPRQTHMKGKHPEIAEFGMAVAENENTAAEEENEDESKILEMPRSDEDAA